jgi:endonuclease/exonuclease/phosphatase family metal-dependent hydrolase
MTYNVLSAANKGPGVQAVRDQGFGSELPLSVRIPVAIEKIGLLDPDLIGLQENEGPGRLPISYLREAFPGYTVLFADDSSPILARTGRFRVVDSGLRSLDVDSPACQPSTSARPHCITWAKLEDVPSGRELLIVNTHAPAGTKREAVQARADNAAAIARLLADEADGGAALVVGDFNAASNERRKPRNAHLTVMRASGMVDAADIAARDDSDVPGASSGNWFTDEIDGELHAKVIRRDGYHIDYIWVSSGAEVASWQTLSGPDVGTKSVAGRKVPSWTGVMASDHSPVAADVSFAAEDVA